MGRDGKSYVQSYVQRVDDEQIESMEHIRGLKKKKRKTKTKMEEA